MPVRMNSKAVIKVMIDDPGTFPTAVVALDKDVPKYLAGHFKDKGMGLERLRATHTALGDEDLALALEALDDKAVAALLKKVDPHRTTSEPGSTLAHLKGLAGGEIEPQPKPEKPKKATASKARVPPVTRASADKAASAKGSGTRPTGSTGTGVPSPSEASTPTKRRSKAASSKSG